MKKIEYGPEHETGSIFFPYHFFSNEMNKEIEKTRGSISQKGGQTLPKKLKFKPFHP